ncbi:MAG: S-layer homology domain-containing protein [Firmicutes bacterium]|nr:S-layer homology domain-containing protein [Bacillota bacterium]
MKRKITSIVIIVLLINSFAITANAGTSFPDVDDDAEYAWAVELTKNMGLFKGDENGNFNPYSGITRAEFATVVCRMMVGEFVDTHSSRIGFSDVPPTHWAFKYITWAYENGIVSGYGNDVFGPNDPVTYEQAIKMLLCAVGCEDEALDTGGWPYGYITVAEKLGILIGVENTFGESITRSNIAVLIGNLDSVNFG